MHRTPWLPLWGAGERSETEGAGSRGRRPLLSRNADEVDITLLVPEWYDDTTFQQLCDKVHEYVVNATMSEYCIMRLTSKDPVTVDKLQLAEEAKNEIRKLVNMSKPNTISKPFKPF